MDPVQFRLLNVQHPGTVLSHAQGGVTVTPMPESLNGTLKYDSYAVEEVLAEGKKVIGWEKRNAVPGGAPGRFKRGIGVALNQHHAGRVGYHDGEVGFERVTGPLCVASAVAAAGNGAALPAAVRQRCAGGRRRHRRHVDRHLPRLHRVERRRQCRPAFRAARQRNNHATSMFAEVAEILGFTDMKPIRDLGRPDLTPPAPGWNSGLTTQLQAACSAAADKMRQDCCGAATRLKVDAATLTIKDGVIIEEQPGQGPRL
jgi:hypothetical protein